MKMLFFLFTLLAITFGARDTPAQLPLQNGWLHFAPSPDTRLIYVSDAAGNDATALVYAPAAPEIGADPFNPAGVMRVPSHHHGIAPANREEYLCPSSTPPAS